MDKRVTTRRVACGQVEARDISDAARALDDARAMVAAAGEAGCDLCVLPEGTYPAYVLGSAEAGRAALAAGPDPIDVLGAAARKAGVEVVAGLVLDSPAGLLNAAVHFGRRGEVRARVAKRFLWHFDRQWFAPGGMGQVADGVGALVCADGRLPEIAGGLVERGACLLANATAWVCLAPPPEGTNPQAEFLWRVRALENGVAAVAATKVGSEAGVALYSGRSQVVAPDGSVVAIASATEPELLVAEVEVPDRPRPPFESAVAVPALPIRPPLRPGNVYVVVLTDESLLGSLEGHGAGLVVGPAGVLRADDVRVAQVRCDAMLIPGPARAAAFAGAEVLVWVASPVSTPWVEEVARARAVENRVFVALWRPLDAGGPLIVSPAGRVLARAPLGGRAFAVAAPCLLAEAATKEMAPGTDAWDGVVGLG